MKNHAPDKFSGVSYYSFSLTSAGRTPIIAVMVLEDGNMGKFAQNPEKKKGKAALLAALLLLLAVGTGIAAWAAGKYCLVSGRLYPKDAQVLDLRGEEIRPSHVDKLRAKLPDCEIRWNIPFQGGLLADDAASITVTKLSEEDVHLLDYARQLKTVQAEDCRDYDALALLRQHRPEVEVRYEVVFGQDRYRWDVETLLLNHIAEAEIPLLNYLPNLKTVAITAQDYPMSAVAMLQGAVHERGLTFGIQMGGEIVLDTETSLTVTGITEEELRLIPLLTNLEQVRLRNPESSSVKLEHIRAGYTEEDNMEFSWEVEIGGQVFDNTVTEADLSMVEITDLAEVERKLSCLPELETVIFGLCGVDDPNWGNSRSKLAASSIENEEMAAYRDRVRENYKVVWTVRLGPSIALRTDADNFMPNHFGVGQLPDSYAYNLRYCEDMVCLDVGHMTLTDISFVEYMPNLKYLILAWTEVQYIEPIRSCKNLVFLELDWSCIRDISPLVDCTALEDLNLGSTYCDITPLKEMTWLKNVYMIRRHSAGVVGQALPDTRVVTSSDPDAATVGYGWRRLPNYYAMRDCLNAPYMN